jgi:UDP-N-acetylmuramoyl-L-alanyl-D-glutamate--2,6-diaminopimelate ligase
MALPPTATSALAEAPVPRGRFEVVHESPYVVVDYAHSPDALARTLQTARRLVDNVAGARGKLFVIFGAGGNRDREKRAPMGEAARIADRVVLTTDNPRDEDPAAIARSIAEWLNGHPDVCIELDRARAITTTVVGASMADVIVIAGKGHETQQILAQGNARFSDIDVARAAVSRR